VSPLRHTLALLALCSEAALLAQIAGLGGAGVAALGGAAWALALTCRAWPVTLEALAYGGLGMTLGGWIDLGSVGLGPAALGGSAPPIEAWCGASAALGGATPFSWMSAGMLLGAAAVARMAGCGLARFAVESGGMLLGMQLAARAAPPLAPGGAAGVLALHAAMNAGMLLGMQLGRIDAARLWLGRTLVARLRTARPATS
jgi:hypothetical protein